MLGNFLKSCSTILDSFSFTQWFKIIILLVFTVTSFHFSDSIGIYLKGYLNGKETVTVKPETVSKVDNTSDGIINSVKESLPKEVPNVNGTKTVQKVKVKINIEYEINTASASGSGSNVPKEVGMRFMMKPPPTMMAAVSITPEMMVMTISKKRIYSLWELYCSDIDSKTICEKEEND